jgi:hypothetical protein
MLSERHGLPAWVAPARYGYAEALQSAGLVVAPLLAGFTITLLGLLVNTSSTGIRHRDLALLILIAAIGALLAAIQFAYEARQFAVTPTEIQAWWPGLSDVEDAGEVDTWWDLRAEQHAHHNMYLLWAKRFRASYHLGIMLLLLGLVVILIPPTPGPRATATTAAVSSSANTGATKVIASGGAGTHSASGATAGIKRHGAGVHRTRSPKAQTTRPKAQTTAPVTKRQKAPAPGISRTRWAGVVVAGLAATAEALWILATLLGATRIPQKGEKRLRQWGRWLALHMPLRRVVAWLAPVYPAALEQASTALAPQRARWEAEHNRPGSPPQPTAEQDETSPDKQPEKPQ